MKYQHNTGAATIGPDPVKSDPTVQIQKGSITLQYSTMLKRTGALGLKTLGHIPAMPRVHTATLARRTAPQAAPYRGQDEWYRSNFAARAQNDFWLRMFVERDKNIKSVTKLRTRP